MSLTQLGELLRWFGQFHSPERLLPKFSYASPGALYATQLFISVRNIPGGIPDGTYYYHPIHHQLYESASYAGPVSNMLALDLNSRFIFLDVGTPSKAFTRSMFVRFWN